jgi:hypothetical protein
MAGLLLRGGAEQFGDPVPALVQARRVLAERRAGSRPG